MKATVIKFYDEQGNEIKNVSTEIVLNGETYVKKEADKQPDYSHLVGMWVKYWLKWYVNDSHVKGWWCVESVSRDKKDLMIKVKNWHKEEPTRNEDWKGINDTSCCFDLTNPLPYNPDTVVGLKELPNDGKTYAECLEDVKILDKIRAIKGLFYEYNQEYDQLHSERGDTADFFHLNQQNGLISYFNIHTPAKPIIKVPSNVMFIKFYDRSLGLVHGNKRLFSSMDGEWFTRKNEFNIIPCHLEECTTEDLKLGDFAYLADNMDALNDVEFYVVKTNNGFFYTTDTGEVRKDNDSWKVCFRVIAD